VDLVGLLVGDLNAELLLSRSLESWLLIFSEGNKLSAYLLNGHDNLDGIQAVQTEVVGEVGNTVDLDIGKC
jgi:hypothetical protein